MNIRVFIEGPYIGNQKMYASKQSKENFPLSAKDPRAYGKDTGRIGIGGDTIYQHNYVYNGSDITTKQVVDDNGVINWLLIELRDVERPFTRNPIKHILK